MSTLGVVAEVLRAVAPQALRARQIAALAGSRLPTTSKTPETVISRDLAIDVRDRGAASRFLRADRGSFLLKEALSAALYNDVDPFVGHWTKNLIAAGEIAAGVVDERSIRDLKPKDVAGYRQCHFFAGVGTWSRALRDAGWPDDVSIWTGSCPCVDFSSAGKRRGFDGDHHFWPDWFRLIDACRPAVVVGEQVSSKAGRAWLDLVFDDLEKSGYACQAFDTPACSIGAPHRRQRFYFVAYARERGREILGASWLHDRGQRRDDAPGCRAVDRGASCAVSDAERVLWSAGRIGGSHGWSEVESDRHGEAHGDFVGEAGEAGGTGCDCIRRTVELGDAGLSRGGRDAGAFPRAQGAGEGERIEARDLADESVASGAVDRAASRGVEAEVVRGATGVAGGRDFRPGDRIRIDGDPSWGGAVRGYWAKGVEWIYCRPEPGHQDGRWRPAESGTQPLVDGLAPDMGRTRAARLRGFGNAIVLPQATAFVESVIDSFVDAARSLGLLAVDASADPAICLAETTDVHAEESAA